MPIIVTFTGQGASRGNEGARALAGPKPADAPDPIVTIVGESWLVTTWAVFHAM